MIFRTKNLNSLSQITESVFYHFLRKFLMVICLLISGYATFKQVLKFYSYQQSTLSIENIVIAVIFTLGVQLAVLFGAWAWWKTRLYRYLFLTLLFTTVSSMFAYGFFYDYLETDKRVVQQNYKNELDGTRNKLYWILESIDILARETGKMVVYTRKKYDEEKNIGGTCNVYGPGRWVRAVFREKDFLLFNSFHESFQNTGEDIEKITDDIEGLSKHYSVDNVRKHNIFVQRLAPIIDGFEQKKQTLLGKLSERVKHNEINFEEKFYDFGTVKGFVKCPDSEIDLYYLDLKSKESIETISPFNILDLEALEAHSIHGFRVLLSILKMETLLLEEYIMLGFAIMFDFFLFLLAISTIKPSPPSSLSTWHHYWSDEEYSRLRKYVVRCDQNFTDLYIPMEDSGVKTGISSLVDAKQAIFRRKIFRWQVFLCVPNQIRKLSNTGFYHYGIRTQVVSQWEIDYRLKQS